MRGKEWVESPWHDRDGITPAYAGKREDWESGKRKPPDHPRLCGEKIVPNVEAITLVGSPPPMRGKVEFSYSSTLS